MNQNYGPYYCVAGEHVQDDLTDITLKVKEVKDGHVFTDAGRRLEIVRGSYLLVDGKGFSCWAKDRRTTPTNLMAGDEVTLCQQKVYGAPSTPPNVRRDGVIYGPFRSHRELMDDPNINKPGVVPKIARATDKAQSDEITELRRINAELIERINAKPPATPADTGQKMAENADQVDRKNQPRGGTGTERKQLQPA